MRIGPRIGLDVGKSRVGVARCDREGLLATPVVTLRRESALEDILELSGDIEPLEIVVGLPLNLRGSHTPSTDDAVEFARELAAATSIPVRMVDERLSTVEAQAGLRSAGKSQKSQRPVIDQAAAVILLQHALDSEKRQGVAPGRLITGADTS